MNEETYDPTFMDGSAKYIRGYQLGDIKIEGIQELLRGKLISSSGECSKEHGWLSSNEHGHVLKLMRQYRESVQNEKS